MSNTFKQFRIVEGSTAAEFQAALNDAMYELRGKAPVPIFSEADPYMAKVQYTEYIQVQESERIDITCREFGWTCKDCPYYEWILKANGTPDLRIKYGNCPHAEYGRTYRDSTICQTLISKIKRGEVRLCAAESE